MLHRQNTRLTPGRPHYCALHVRPQPHQALAHLGCAVRDPGWRAVRVFPRRRCDSHQQKPVELVVHPVHGIVWLSYALAVLFLDRRPACVGRCPVSLCGPELNCCVSRQRGVGWIFPPSVAVDLSDDARKSVIYEHHCCELPVLDGILYVYH